jgi:hypothetical protein
VHRQVIQFAHLIGEAAPSYWVVRDIVLSLPKDLQTLAQQGTRRFGELYDLVHKRDASKPNALWQADHAQLDILLLREDGAPARPWLTAVIDDYSDEMQSLLEQHWTPLGVSLPESAFTPEVVARLIRITGGNLRLLTRILTQVERVLNVNDAQAVSLEIVEAARDSLVIGQA